VNAIVDPEELIISSIINEVAKGSFLAPILRAMGISRDMWERWLHERPQLAREYARAQETWAEALVKEALVAAKDETKDAKSRRVIVDTNLRVAALLAPRRFSQAAVDRLAAPLLDDEQIPQAAEELARRLIMAVNIGRPRLEHQDGEDAEEAEFDEV
jgi:hypothetical protein